MRTRVPVTFQPSGFTAWVEPGATVLAAGRAAGVNISAPCGGRGVCGACGVRVIEGALAKPTRDETAAMKRAALGIRLACRARVDGPVTLRPIVVNSTLSRSAGPLEGDSELAIGVDLGTTTLSAAVVDLATGRQVGTATVLNRQQSYGADILSRVSAALEGSAVELRDLAMRSVIDVIDCAAPGARTRIARIVVAANVAMSTLLTGAESTTLASHPFSTPHGCDVLGAGSALHEAYPHAKIELVPPIGGFVGGDALAGLVALGLGELDGPYMLVDIGTNAEVALVRKNRVWMASAAAGPAFEGGGTSCGGPAAPEAVVAVEIEGDGSVRLTGASGVSPAWFSGAGLVSAVAALRRAGHIDSEGAFGSDGPLRERFSTSEDGVLGVGLGDPGGCLTVTQLDVRELQLAKGAVQVAVSTVLAQARTRTSELRAIYVAGAFGAALSSEDLKDLGVLPQAAERVIVYAGNTALRGATAIAVDASLMQTATKLADRATVLDLASDPGFSNRLVQALALTPYSA